MCIRDRVDHLADYKAEAAREPYLFGLAQGAEENVERIVGAVSYTHLTLPTSDLV